MRVVKPQAGGALRDADYAAMTWWPDVPGLRVWQDVNRKVARAHGGEPDAGRRLLGWVQDAGLLDVRTFTSA